MEAQISPSEISKITEEIELLLHQFIRCSKDGIFDSLNLHENLCESCSYERAMIMGLVAKVIKRHRSLLL